MNEQRLSDFVSSIGAIAKDRGHEFRVDLPAPALERNIELVEAFAKSALPLSLRAFLRQHDGLRLTMLSHEGTSDETAYVVQEFEVFGTPAILDKTRMFRDLLSNYRESGAEMYTEALAARYLRIASFGSFDWFTLLDLAGIRSASDEGPIIFVSEDDAELPTEPPAPIAADFEEFLNRSLQFMVETRGGFCYWLPPEVDW